MKHLIKFRGHICAFLAGIQHAYGFSFDKFNGLSLSLSYAYDYVIIFQFNKHYWRILCGRTSITLNTRTQYTLPFRMIEKAEWWVHWLSAQFLDEDQRCILLDAGGKKFLLVVKFDTILFDIIRQSSHIVNVCWRSAHQTWTGGNWCVVILLTFFFSSMKFHREKMWRTTERQ